MASIATLGWKAYGPRCFVYLRQHGQDTGPKGNALADSPWAAGFWRLSFARRPPMFVFAFEAELLTFR